MTDWAKLKVVDLKAELKRRELPQHGLKAELVARLEEATAPVADEAPIDAVDAEPAPPVEEAIPETETSATAPCPAPETTAAKSETREASVPVEASEEPANAAEETQPGNAEQQSLPAAVDAPSDASQKRKRKSPTPSPDEEEVAIKRARALSEQGEEQRPDDVASAPASEETGAPAGRPGSPMAVEQTPPTGPNKAEEHQQPLASPPPTQLPETIAPAVSDNDNDNYDKMHVDEDLSVAPAVHPATAALYISNLMRPLRPADIQAHVCELAGGGAVSSSNSQATPADGGGGVIVQFHLDQIRTHAFVVLSSVQAAARVRSKLHDRVWPNESNRKALCVDFVPTEKIDDWIAMEQGGGGGGGGGGGRPGRSTARWEVIYTTGPDGIVEARLQQAGGGPASSRGGPPRLPSFSQASATDTAGFRGDRDHNRDRDRERGGGGDLGSPRGSRRDGPNPRQERAIPPPPSELDYELQRTRARPSIKFQLVAPALAERRIDNMRSFYTKDTRRVLGREINRYSFEEGDGFVDRGKEVFEGIRPPHRERGGGGGGGRRGGGMFGGRGGGGGGGGGGSRGRRNGGGDRPRSDRYLPGSSFGGGGGRRWDNDRSGDRRY
ncbi:hypothetical protein MY10362_005281 [Beauveria mimosiformis]